MFTWTFYTLARIGPDGIQPAFPSCGQWLFTRSVYCTAAIVPQVSPRHVRRLKASRRRDHCLPKGQPAIICGRVAMDHNGGKVRKGADHHL